MALIYPAEPRIAGPRPNWLLPGLICAGLAARLWIAFLPVQQSFRLSVPDDAYYYFALARNVVAGHGLTVDGLSTTNGFHPLWLALIVPLWLLAPGAATLPIQVALAGCAVLDTFAGLVLYRLAVRLVADWRMAIFAPALYLLNPYGIALGVDGMETSLAVCLFGSALLLSWRLLDDLQAAWPARSLFAAGCVWGLLLAARTDFVFVSGGMCFYLSFLCLKNVSGRGRRAVALCFGCALPLLPWLAWSLSVFGTVMQVSHDAYPFYLHTLWLADNGPDFARLLQTEASMLYRAGSVLSHMLGLSRAFPFVAAALALVVWRTRGAGSRLALKRLLLPSLLASVPLFYHSLYRWYFQPWYAMPLNYLVALWLAVGFAALRDAGHARLLPAALLCVFALYAAAGLELVQRGGVYPGQRVALAREYCGGLSRIGDTDSGFEGYFAECPVVNLDGVVNNQAYTAIRNGTFYRYLDEMGIQQISMNPIVARVVALTEGPARASPPWSQAGAAK